jgi:hypothetical protein
MRQAERRPELGRRGELRERLEVRVAEEEQLEPSGRQTLLPR